MIFFFFIILFIPFFYVLSQPYPGDSCSFHVPMPVCNLQRETKFIRSQCPVNDAKRIGLNNNFLAFYQIDPSSSFQMTYCKPSMDPLVFNIPTEGQGTINTILTLALFDRFSDYTYESSITVITEKGGEHKIGTFIPFINTLTNAQKIKIPPLNSTENIYPFNGKEICFDKLSYQRWDIPDELNALKIKSVKIYDSKQSLRVYAMTLNNCSGYVKSVNDMDITRNLDAKVDTLLQGKIPVISSGMLSWAHCYHMARRSGYTGFLYQSDSTKCTFLNRTSWLVKSMITPQKFTMFGGYINFPSRYSEFQDIPNHTHSKFDDQSFLRNNLYGGLNPRLFLKKRNEKNLKIPIGVKNLRRYAVGAAQVEKKTSAFLTAYAGSHISTCGSPYPSLLEQPIHWIYPTKYTNYTGNASYCNRFSHCPIEKMALPFNGNLIINWNKFPSNVDCSTQQGSNLLVYFDADYVGYSNYSYMYPISSSLPVQFDNITVFLAGFYERSVLEIYNFELYKISSTGWLSLFSLSTNLSMSPIWHHINSEGRTESSDLLCQAFNAPSFSVQYRKIPTSTGYKCNNYTSVFEISMACDLDTNCMGFSTTQESSTGFESPGCMYFSINPVTDDNTATLFVKSDNIIECKFDASLALWVKLKVTSTIVHNTLFEVFADNNVVGNCSFTSGSDSDSLSCYEFYDCWSGDIPQGTKSIFVRAKVPIISQSRCGKSLFSVSASFDSSKKDFLPDSRCLTELKQSSCRTASVTSPCTDRIRSALAIGSSACIATLDDPVIIDVKLDAGNISYVGIVMILDFLASPIDEQPNGLVQLLVTTLDGATETLGYMARKDGSTLKFFSIFQTPLPSYPLCQQNVANSVGQSEYFAIPRQLLLKGINRFILRGPTVHLISAYLVSRTCGASVFYRNTDAMFGVLSRGIAPSGIKLSSNASFSDITDCALFCFIDERCNVYSWKNSVCTIYTSYGRLINYEEFRVTGTRSRQLNPPFNYKYSSYGKGITVSDVINTLSNSHSYMTAFATNNVSNPLRLMMRHSTGYQLSLGQTVFGNSGAAVISSVASFGGSQVCGNGYDLFQNGLGVSGNCSNLRLCPQIQLNNAITSTVQLFPIKFVTNPSCAYQFWGIIGTNGSVLNGLEYHRVTLLSKGTNYSYGKNKSIVSVQKFDANISNISYTVILSEGSDDLNPAEISISSTTIMCRVGIKIFFNVYVGVRSGKNTFYNCSNATNAPGVDQAMKMCNEDSQCEGFTVDNSTGSVLCFSTNAKTSINDVNTILFRKNVIKNCIFTISVPGMISIAVAQLNLFQNSGNDVKIYINGYLKKTCGSTNPWNTGYYDNTNASNCNNYIECLNELIPDVGTIEIVFPESDDTCQGHYGAAIVYLYSPAQSKSIDYHIAASTMHYRRTISTSTSTLNFQMDVSGASVGALLVEQDRYECPLGTCLTPFVINYTVGVNSVRCGGLVGFKEGRGLSNYCEHYYYCGDASSRIPKRYPQIANGPILIKFANSVTSNYCQKRFRSILFTDGLLLGAEETASLIRAMFIIIHPSGSAKIEVIVKNLKDKFPIVHPNMTVLNPGTLFLTYYKPFRVVSNLEISPKKSFAVYDFPSINDEDKSLYNGTWACIADGITVDGRMAECRMRVTSNYITVWVSQGKFDQKENTISIITNNFTQICGGDITFQGYAGLLGACDRYFTCFQGYIEANTIIKIRYSLSSVHDSPCHPGAVTYVTAEPREEVPPLKCDKDTLPFKCIPDNVCLPFSKICDRQDDCTDGSDEAKCLNWIYAGSGMAPKCSPLKEFNNVMNSDDCKRYAVLAYTPTVYTYTRSSKSCKLFSCVNFDNPDITTMDISPDTDLFVYTRNPLNFKYCTNVLHCGNNGFVLSTHSPCVCKCKSSFVGDSCSILLGLGVTTQLAVVFPPKSVFPSAFPSLTAAIKSHLSQLDTVVVDTIEYYKDLTGVFLTIRDPSGNLADSRKLRSLLINSTATSIMSQVKNLQPLYVTAIGPSTTQFSYTCRQLGGCSTLTLNPINSTRTISVGIPGVIFSGSQKYVDIVLSNDGSDAIFSKLKKNMDSESNNMNSASYTFRCDDKTATNTIDTHKTGNCANIARCTVALNGNEVRNANKIDIKFSPGFSTSVICDNNPINVIVNIYGYDYLVKEEIVSSPVITENYQSGYLYAFYILFAFGVVGVILFVTWFRIRQRKFKQVYIGPVIAGITFIIFVSAFSMLVYYYEAKELFYSHDLVIEEYRDMKCDTSRYAPLPIRTANIRVDHECHRLEFLGDAEGTMFAAASVEPSKGNFVFIKSGGNLKECNEAKWTQFEASSCLPENLLSPWKREQELQFVSLRGMISNLAKTRFNSLKTLNPTRSVDFDARVSILPKSVLWNNDFSNDLITMNSLSGIVNIGKPKMDPVYLMVPRNNDIYMDQTPFTLDNVTFVENITTVGSLFSKSKKFVFNEPPRQMSETFSNIGTIFNDKYIDFNYFGIKADLRSIDATNTFLFYGVKGSDFDLGKLNDFTLHFWIKANEKSRGVVFAVADAWLRTDLTSPIIERFISQVENGINGPSEFDFPWNLYAAVYIDAISGEIKLASSNPKLSLITWTITSIDADRLFDGGWHFVAITVRRAGQNIHFLQLFIDGQTNSNQEEWIKCSNFAFKPVSSRNVGDIVRVYDNKDVVTAHGVLILGHFNGGVYGVGVHPTILSQEELFSLGARGMEKYANVYIAESLVIGIVCVVIATIIVIYSLYYAFQKEFGSHDQEFDELSQCDKNGDATPFRPKQPQSSIFVASTQFSNFISPVLLLFQTVTLFLQGWNWPYRYNIIFGYLSIVSFDLYFFLPAIPLITWAIIQYIVALIVFIFMIYVYVRDSKKFEDVVDSYKSLLKVKTSSFRTDPESAASFDVPQPIYKWVVHTREGTKELTPEQQGTLITSLNDLLRTKYRAENNMRIYTKKVVDFGDAGIGIILYERINGRVYISLRTSLHELEYDKKTDVLDLSQTYFELVCDNSKCPEHDATLVFDKKKRSHSCVHSQNILYRSKSCPTNCVMFVCPEEGCGYAVCEYCHSTISFRGQVSEIFKNIKEEKTVASTSFLGSFLVILAEIIYIPCIKNAFMIVRCHLHYHCEYGRCWESPSLSFLVMAIISIAILIIIGIGFIVLNFLILYKRRQVMLSILPIQNRPPKSFFYDLILPKKTCLKADYEEFLNLDNTMLQALYSSYEFDYFYAFPFLLIYRLILIMFVTLTIPDRLGQIGLVAFISLIFAVIIVIVNMYKNIWIEFVVRISALHNLILIALMCLHRVNVLSNLDSKGYTNQMIAFTILYIILVVLIWISAVIVPFIKKLYARHKNQQSLKANKKEEVIDVGPWGDYNMRNMKDTGFENK